MPIVAFDIFCGAGGVTYGLRAAGIRVAIGVDKEEDCRLAYTQNNPSARFLCHDIRKLPASTLLSHGASVSGDDFLLLAACAPCQPFSSQNQNRSGADDRAVLRNVERLVHDLRPDFLLIENVPGLRKIQGFSAFRRLLRALRVLKYKVRFGVIDAAWYGVPQHRRRLVLTASLHGKAPWPDQTHGGGPGRAPFVTVRQAISNYPPLRAGEEHPTLPNHVAPLLKPHNLERLRVTAATVEAETIGLPISSLNVIRNTTAILMCMDALNGMLPHPRLRRGVPAYQTEGTVIPNKTGQFQLGKRPPCRASTTLTCSTEAYVR